jgi:hypothetical protein
MLIVSDKSGNGKGAGFSRRAEITGTMEEDGRSLAVVVLGEFNLSLSGVWDATVTLVRSLDGGETYQPLTALGGDFTFTNNCEEVFNEPQPGVLYAIEVTDYVSGTINYRIGQ